MSREVPGGWKALRIADVLTIRRGVTWDKDAELAPGNDDAMPVISIPNIQDRLVLDHLRYIRKTSISNIERFIARSGWTLMVGSNGNPDRVGNCVLASGVDECLFASFLLGIYPIDTSEVLPEYAYRILSNQVVQDAISASVQGTTGLRNISVKMLRELEVAVPPLHEQHRIAEILSSVDEAIAATRAVIEQTRKVKQGVLERLLSEGIGHTRFKQTEIGEIPEEWDLATLEELLADIPNPMRSGPFGSALKSEELVETGVPFLGIDNIQVEQFIRNYKRFLSEDKFRQLRRFAVNPNDVVITIMGTVGRCCVVPPDIGEAVSSKHIWAMSLNRERYIAELACWQMNFAPWIVSKFTTSAQGGIMSAINSGILRKLVFPVPGLEEQHQIFQVWQSFQSELEVEQAKLQNLDNLKSALMSDLLTGRKRVTDALPMAAE